jgi:Tn3 transposase DDE domain
VVAKVISLLAQARESWFGQSSMTNAPTPSASQHEDRTWPELNLPFKVARDQLSTSGRARSFVNGQTFSRAELAAFRMIQRVLADNDPAEQEKLIKFNTLLANLVIFHNALDIMDVVRGLVAEGWLITAGQLGRTRPEAAQETAGPRAAGRGRARGQRTGRLLEADGPLLTGLARR